MLTITKSMTREGMKTLLGEIEAELVKRLKAKGHKVVAYERKQTLMTRGGIYGIFSVDGEVVYGELGGVLENKWADYYKGVKLTVGDYGSRQIVRTRKGIFPFEDAIALILSVKEGLIQRRQLEQKKSLMADRIQEDIALLEEEFSSEDRLHGSLFQKRGSTYEINLSLNFYNFEEAREVLVSLRNIAQSRPAKAK